MDGLLTTQEAAARAGVGTTAIKRWADSGLLPCLRTAGGHRRFRAQDVDTLMRDQLSGDEAGVEPDTEADAADGEAVSRWVDLLVGEHRPHAILGHLYTERAHLGGWFNVAGFVGRVLTEIGALWERGELSILQEHLASERLNRALARAVESIPVAESAPSAILACAEGDDHTLGLACAELCLREAGWSSRWAGRATPVEQLTSALDAGVGDLVAASASSNSRDRVGLLRWVNRVAESCCRRSVPLVLGGLGAWPDPPPYGVRIASFEAFHLHLLELNRRA